MAVPVYSHSRLSVYETCPRQYKAVFAAALVARGSRAEHPRYESREEGVTVRISRRPDREES